MQAGFRTRIVAIVAVVALSTGTVFAAYPSLDPSASIGPSSEPSASAQASTSASAQATASAQPSASASHGPAATPKPSKAPKPGASQTPDQTEASDAAPTAAEITDIVAKLKAVGITTSEAEFKALAAKVGVGGAVRTMAFAHASGKTPAQILAMRDGGMGWGQIRKQLNLSITPGIGWIMGGGHGH